MEITNSIKLNETDSQELEFANILNLCAIILPINLNKSLQIIASPGHQLLVLETAKAILNIINVS